MAHRKLGNMNSHENDDLLDKKIYIKRGIITSFSRTSNQHYSILEEGQSMITRSVARQLKRVRINTNNDN